MMSAESGVPTTAATVAASAIVRNVCMVSS
jgi:hypothetical protein